MDNRNRFYKFFHEPGWSKAQALLAVLDRVAAERNVPVSEVAVNWTIQKPFVSTALFGTQHRERVIENVNALDWALTDADIQKIDAAINEIFEN